PLPEAEGKTLVQLTGLSKHFPQKIPRPPSPPGTPFMARLGHGLVRSLVRMPATLKAVDRVDLDITSGETVGLVGESGCGKSTLGRTLLRLLEPTAGEIVFDGVDLTKLSRRELKAERSEMQIIFQDSVGSLDPRMRVRDL